MNPLLLYSITTNPFPLQASAAGKNPNIAQLTIVATNAAKNDVRLKAIIIKIPVGQGSEELTNDARHIGPVSPEDWKDPQIQTPKGFIQYTFMPKTGHSTLGSDESVNVVFNNIQVNTKTGTIEVEVTEGNDTCQPGNCPVLQLSVTKFPHEWGEVKFWVNPPVIPLGGNTTLNWSGPAGATYTIEYYTPQTGYVRIPKEGKTPLSNSGQEPSLMLQQGTVFTLNVRETIDGNTYQAQDQKSVNVSIPPPTIRTFEGFFRQDDEGSELILNWDTDAEKCKITGDPYWLTPTSLDNSYTVALSAKNPLRTRYALTAKNASGETTSTLIVVWKVARDCAIKSPAGVCLSPDGTRVYVVNQDDGTGRNGEVITADPSTLQPICTPVKIAWHSFGIAVSPDGTRLYAANEISNSVTVLDASSDVLAPLSVVAAGWRPKFIAVRRDGKRIFVANINDGTLSVFSPTANRTNPLSPVGPPLPLGPTGINSISALAISPDGSRVYAGANGNNPFAIIVVDAETLQFVGGPVAVENNSAAIAVTSDNAYAIAAINKSILIYSTTAGENNPLRYIGRFSVPIEFSILGSSLDGSCIYALCQDTHGNSAWITVDLSSLKIIGDILNFGRLPAGIAISNDGTKMFVTTQTDGKLWALTPALSSGESGN